MLLIAVSLIGVLLYFVIGGEEARLNLSSMRILWQLAEGRRVFTGSAAGIQPAV
jgi:hypothetical protein